MRKIWNKIIIGLFLTIINISFPNILPEFVLPIFGLCLLIIGFSQLREVDKKFNNIYHLSIFYLWVMIIAVIISSIRMLPVYRTSGFLLQLLYIVLKITLVDLLYRDMKFFVQSKAGNEKLGKYLKRNIVFVVLANLSIMLAYMDEMNMEVYFLIYLVIEVVILINLLKTKKYIKMLDIEVSIKHKFKPYIISVCSSAVMIIGMLLGMYIASQDKIQIINTSDKIEDAKIESIKLEMIKSGFPEAILEDLLPEEVLEYEGIWKVQVYKKEIYHKYAKAHLEMTLVVSSLPRINNNHAVRIMTYVRWKENPKGRYSDLVKININDSVYSIDDKYYHSASIYDRVSGDTKDKVYYELKQSSFGIRNGQNFNYMIKIPRTGENFRSYFSNTYSIQANYVSIGYTVNYIHRSNLWLYPNVSNYDLLSNVNWMSDEFINYYERIIFKGGLR